MALAKDPSDWFYNSQEVYDYFCHQQYSFGYISSILRLSNLWGHFISRKTGKPFLPVLLPNGYEKRRLLESFYQKVTPRKRASATITPETLNKTREKMNVKNFNWTYLSVWFGLRPQEIDNLKDESKWKLETLPTERKILWVYQTKIIALPPEDRWKPIPILCDEQIFGLKIIKDQNFKRPLLKTMKKYFSDKVNLYGGRKGFVDLMLSKGHAMENISIWMGHSTLSRTWRSYKNKRVYHL